MNPKQKSRRHRVNASTIEFKQDWLAGARIVIAAENTPYKDGKPLWTTTLDLTDEWVAMALFENARKAVEWHRAQQAKKLQTLDDCLAGR